MDELNKNDNQTTNNFEEKNSSSFILQSYLNDTQQQNILQYELKAPLCVSKIYEDEFFDSFHINYYGELEHEGLFLISIRSTPIKINEEYNKSSNTDEDNQLIRAIIRTEYNNYDVSTIINIKNEEHMLKVLFEKAELSSICHYELIHHIKANEKILEFDKYIDEQHSNKIAIIFQNLNQTNENDILSNNKMSIKMKNFVNLISERIQLKDFNKYRGDLDIKINQHGIYSYFTIFKNHQIMFNIAPIIPSDQQFIQRKSLIANALLCIVFQEEETLFKPDFILGKVTQVYITVQPFEFNTELYYKIEIWRRSDIEPIIDPPGGIFKHDQSFRDYFLTLILNTMNIIYKKDCFHLRIIEQRQRLKNEYLKKLFQIFYSYSQHDLVISSNNNSDDDGINENLNRKRRSSSKSHRHLGFIPKIISSFMNNRSRSPTQATVKYQPSSTSHTCFLRKQDISERPTDAITSSFTKATNLKGTINETPSATLTINNNEDNLNKNQNTQIKLNNELF